MNGRDVPQCTDEEGQTCEDENDILALGGCFLPVGRRRLQSQI